MGRHRLGLPADRVTWTGDADPSADHDIASINEDGSALWIEVQSTTGHDGQFSWTAAEFRLRRSVLAAATSSTASSKASTTTPSWSRVCDPRVAAFEAGNST